MQLKISSKLFLTVLPFLVPMLYLLYSFVSTLDGTINFTQLELKGDRYERPLMTLMEDLSVLERQIQRAQHNVPLDTQKVTETVAQVEDTFRALDILTSELSDDLQLNDAGLAKRNRQNLKLS